jgi:LPS export ABC transporter protein LptC
MNQQESDFNFKNNIFLKKVAVLITVTAAFFYGCESNIEKIKPFNSYENLPVVEARDFETLYTDSGKIRFFLKTPLLLRYEPEGKPYIEFPEGIELIKYDNNQNVISSITASYAKQFVEEKKWEAKNNVVATNIKGDTLKTEHLIWEENTEKIYTDEYVKIIRTDQIITGIGFQSDQSLENWRIKNPRGTIYITPETRQKDTFDDPLTTPAEKQEPVDLNN